MTETVIQTAFDDSLQNQPYFEIEQTVSRTICSTVTGKEMIECETIRRKITRINTPCVTTNQVVQQNTVAYREMRSNGEQQGPKHQYMPSVLGYTT